METQILTFGDIIEYRDGEYVYLNCTPEIMYLAKIIDRGSEYNGILVKMKEKNADDSCKKPQIRQARNALFCFVILTTENHEGDLAHLNQTEQSFSNQIRKKNLKLNMEDLKKIKDEIMSEETVPKKLKQLTEQVEI